MSVSTPTYILLLASQIEEPMSGIDTIFPQILIGLVVFEWFADQQQWGTFDHLS